MAYDNYELSNDDGRPARGYRFKLGVTQWHYWSGPQDITLDGERWVSVPISDDGVKFTGEATTDILTVTAPDSIGPAKVFLGTPPSDEIEVTVFGFHAGEAEMIVEYVGEITQIDWPDPGTVKISCESLFASMARDGLRYGWQRSCPFALYEPRTCKVDKTKYEVPAVILTASQGVISANEFASKPPGYFNGGFLTWNHPVRGVEYRGIEEHSGTQIVMFGSSDGLYYGLPVRAYPGCNRTVDHCENRFNNFPNYGGIPDLPGRSPFDGLPFFS
jgi:uncharacterized phage protein (TIGR02218 family)